MVNIFIFKGLKHTLAVKCVQVFKLNLRGVILYLPGQGKEYQLFLCFSILQSNYRTFIEVL